MTGTLPNPALPVGSPSWFERHLPWIVSGLLHLVLFVWLIDQTIDIVHRPEPRKQQVKLVIQPVPTQVPMPMPPPALAVPKPPPSRGEEQPTQPEPEPPKPVEPPVEVAVLQPVPTIPPRPTRMPTPEPRPTEPSIFAPDLPPTAVPEPTTEPKPTPDPARQFMEEQKRRIEEIRERYKKTATNQRRKVLERRKDIGERLQKYEQAAEASSHFSNYKGARTGAIRTLNLDNAPSDAQQRVMDRYNIRITQQYVSNAAPSYLNSAATGGSVYHPSTRPGYYEVFVISAEAQKKMWYLETRYLQNHGYEPGSAMVDTVEFGVVRDPETKDWDLGILHIEVRQTRPVNAPTIDAP